jgi:large-conductance mechanosensitive channel
MAAQMDNGSDDSPKQVFDGIKFTIFRRRIGQIALAVVLAEACIRFISSLVWYLIIPAIANLLETHTDSVLFKNRRSLPWEQLIGNTLEFVTVIVFVYYANRWIYRLSQPKKSIEEQRANDEELLVPRMLSAESSAPTTTERDGRSNN